MARTWPVSSAARTSRSRSGSLLTDSTGMPSRATSDRARAPSIRLLIWLSCSRNIARAPLTQALEVRLQDVPHPTVRRVAGLVLVAEEEVAGFERPAPPLGAAQAVEAGQRRRVLRLALEDFVEDPLGLLQVPLSEVELAQGRGR